MDDFTIRPLKFMHLSDLCKLYQTVALNSGGIAREAEEIKERWLGDIFFKCEGRGIQRGLFIQDQLIAEIHAYFPDPKAFSHVLTDLTLVVSPDFQGRQLGFKLFSAFLEEAQSLFPQLVRVELFVRESNLSAQKLYSRLGFQEEGRLKNRIRSKNGNYEDDVLMAWQKPSQTM